MLEAVERQNEEVVMQLQELELKTKHFQGLEERFVQLLKIIMCKAFYVSQQTISYIADGAFFCCRFWHEFNDFKLQLTVHQVGNFL